MSMSSSVAAREHEVDQPQSSRKKQGPQPKGPQGATQNRGADQCRDSCSRPPAARDGSHDEPVSEHEGSEAE